MIGGMEIAYSILSNDAAVVANTSGNITTDFVKQGTPFPYVVMQTIDATPVDSLTGFNGLLFERIQIDCYANYPKDSRQTAKLVWDALTDHPNSKHNGHVLQAIDFLGFNATNEPDDEGDEVPVSRTSADYMLYYHLC